MSAVRLTVQSAEHDVLWICSNTTNIVPRLAEANDRIPAYVDNSPAWGSKPIAVRTDPSQHSVQDSCGIAAAALLLRVFICEGAR